MQTNSLIGHRLGNYKIDSLIDQGGMGSVYEGVHMLLGRRAAIKQLNPILEQKEGVKERFKNEAIILSKLKHPHIVSIYDYIECDKGTFIIMELIKGTALDVYLKNESGPIPEPRAVRYISQMLDAIGYMHSKSIIHRDIKPGNFIITAEDEIKMLDFGIAQLIGETPKHLTQPGTKVGTALYMSPQQVKGQPLDRRTDIYSLGITFFQMLTGQHPYDIKLSEYDIYNKIINEPLPPPSSIYAGVSPQMEDIIYKATAKKPLDRYQNCSAFLHDVKAAAKQTSGEEKNLNTQIFELTPADTEKKQSAWRNIAILLVVSVFLLAVAVSVFTFGRHDQMHVIGDNAHLYKADSLNSERTDKLNYGETVRIVPDRPEIINNGTAWVVATSLRGTKGYIPKKHLVSSKIYQQINSMFMSKEAIDLTPCEYKLALWKYFVENKYFRNSSTSWKISSDTKNELDFSGTASGKYNANQTPDYACVLHSLSDRRCRLLIFFDQSSENIAIDFPNEVRIKTIPAGEQGGGWFLGNTYTRTAANGSLYEVDKYEFLTTDGIMIYDIEKETNSVCVFNSAENKIHIYQQPK